MCLFRKYKNIITYEKEIKLNNIISSKILDYRKRIKILVIDDQEFSPQQNLKQYGYDIDYLVAIPKIDTVKDYNIILCDLKGVGHNFDAIGEGATLIKQIKKAYPSIFVVAYSGGADPNTIKKANEHADSFLPKDATIDEWTDKLDQLVELALNPVHTWKKTRIALLNYISPIELAKLEDQFVRSLESKNQKLFRNKLEQVEYQSVKDMLLTCYKIIQIFLEINK